MLVPGIVGFSMEENGFPIAPGILGIVTGPMLADNIMATVIKTDGQVPGVFDRPVSGAPGGTLLIWTVPLIGMGLSALRRRQAAEA